MEIEYQLKTIKALDTLPIGVWYPFKSKNHVAEELMEVVKLRIDLSGDYIISNDYTHFKRTELPEKEPITEIKAFIEWKPNSYELNEYERNLQPVPTRSLTKEQEKAYQARRTDK